MKHALIVLANPNTSSFNHRLAQIGKLELEQQGYQVTLLDLYQLDFPSVNSLSDFEHDFDHTDFDYKEEQRRAYHQKSFNPAIVASQNVIVAADLIIFQFPLWWFTMPAILKNWIEKCFSFDFAYNGRERRWFSQGPFKGKSAILSITTSGPDWIYRDNGINGDMERILWPIHNGILNFTGLSVLPPIISWASDTFNRDKRDELEAIYLQRIRCIEQIQPIAFHSLECFDERYVLKPSCYAKCKMEESQWHRRTLPMQ